MTILKQILMQAIMLVLKNLQSKNGVFMTDLIEQTHNKPANIQVTT